MTGKFLPAQSWEKQHYYRMDNPQQSIVGVECSVIYGETVVSIEENGKFYHCSNGLDSFPEWVKEWQEPISPGHWMKILPPKFKKEY